MTEIQERAQDLETYTRFTTDSDGVAQTVMIFVIVSVHCILHVARVINSNKYVFSHFNILYAFFVIMTA